jgi:4-amino-4-deoxy-L-arabinose transferase-like glycosyltransferase
VSGASHRNSDRILLAFAVAAGLAGSLLLRQTKTLEPPALFAWGLLVAAGLAGGWALARGESWLADPLPRPEPAAVRSKRVRLVALLLLSSALLVTALVVPKLWANIYTGWHGTVLPWVAAMAAVLAAGFCLGREQGEGLAENELSPRPSRDSGPSWSLGPIPRGLEITLFLCIALLAAFVRLHRIDQIPPGIYVDETNGALDSLYILEGRGDSPFGVGWYGTPNLFAYYMAGLFRLFGANWESLKAVSLIPAWLTVLAIYPLGRLMFGPVAGLAAMAFLATSRWHMTMSRWGWNEVAPPLFQLLGAYFLLRGLRDRRRSDFAIGGLISGLMMYTYLSSRLALATAGLFALYFLLTARGGPLAAWRRHWRGLVLFLLAWVVAVAPIAVTHLKDPFSFSNRVNEISVFRDVKEQGSYAPLLRNLVDHLRFFHQVGDHQGKHNLPDEPHADPFVGLLFVLGLGHALFRVRDPRRALLLLWVPLGMAGGAFSSNHESPQSYRTLTAMPAVVLLAADALARLAGSAAGSKEKVEGEASRAGGERRRQILAGVVLVGAWGASARWETRVYFGPQAESIHVVGGFNPIENSVARDVLKALDEGTQPYLSPRFYWFSPLRFLVYGKVKTQTGRNTLDAPPWRTIRLEQDLPLPPGERPALLLVDAQYLPVIETLQHFHPDAKGERVRGSDGAVMYLRVRLSAQQLAATAGLLVRSGGTEQVVSSLSGDAVPAGRGPATWVGAIQVPASGSYDLLLPPGITLTIDDLAWTGPRYLGSGLHDLHAVADRLPAEPLWHLEWVLPDGRREEVPSRQLFRVGRPKGGFLAFYYPNPRWEGPPLYEHRVPVLIMSWVEPEPIPKSREFSARFFANLRVDRPGSYRFAINADDGATLLVDGRVVGEVVINERSSFPAVVDLSPGVHALEIRYYQLGGGDSLELYWAPPGEDEVIIPSKRLTPARPASPESPAQPEASRPATAR